MPNLHPPPPPDGPPASAPNPRTLVDVEKIWQQMQRRTSMPGPLAIIRRFVESVPNVIGADLLPEPVTLRIFMLARARIMQHQMQDDGYLRQLADTLPKELETQLGRSPDDIFQTRKRLAAEEYVACMRFAASGTTDDESGFLTRYLNQDLEDGEKTDTAERMAASVATERFSRGDLTIAQLLEIHPGPLLDYA